MSGCKPVLLPVSEVIDGDIEERGTLPENSVFITAQVEYAECPLELLSCRSGESGLVQCVPMFDVVRAVEQRQLQLVGQTAGHLAAVEGIQPDCLAAECPLRFQ